VYRVWLTTFEAGNEDAHNRVGVSGFGIAHGGCRAGVGSEVLDGVKCDASLVHLQISNGRRIRRPPVSGANVQLLGIDPVELAVAQLFAAAASESSGFAVGDADKPEVVVADEADPAAVRRDFGIGDGVFAGDESAARVGFQIVPRERSGALEKERVALR